MDLYRDLAGYLPNSALGGTKPDWKAELQIALQSGFLQIIHVLLGLYICEWFLSLDFELGFLSGKTRRKFKWPMMFYLANRYCMLGALIGTIILLDAKSKSHCDALYTFVQLTGSAAVGLASINLSLRTIVLWSSNKCIVGGLILAILGHWTLIFLVLTTQIKAKWLNETQPGYQGPICVPIPGDTDRKILSAVFIYAMCFDLVVIFLTTYKLFVLNSKKILRQSRITQVIFVDGLIFFIVAFVVNFMATFFTILGLSVFMSLPAPVFSTIVSCRAVRRLKTFSEIIDSERVAENEMRYPINQLNKCEHGAQSGVHIKIETNVHHDIEYQPQVSRKSLNISESDIGMGMVTEESQVRELSSP